MVKDGANFQGWYLEVGSTEVVILQMTKTQDTVSMDTSFIFVVFQWCEKVKA